MRVLVVTPRYVPQMGGVENHVREVARRLRERADITILTTDNSGALSPTESIDGVPVMRVRAWPRGSDYHIAPGLRRAIRAPGTSQVRPTYRSGPHRHDGCVSVGIPYVVTFHGGGPFRSQNALRGLQRVAPPTPEARAADCGCPAEFSAARNPDRLVRGDTERL
jgi:hypothetical protein